MVSSLVERYEKEWDESQRRPIPVTTARPTNPLLLEVPPAYFDSDCKVMVFGKENNDWEGAFPHQGGVAHLLETYRKFYNDGQCYGYGGQFWNGIRWFKSKLQESCTISGKSLHLLWNNVIKVGKEGEKGAPLRPFSIGKMPGSTSCVSR
jgi:hypothetical protein